MSTELHNGEISATAFSGGKARGRMIQLTDSKGSGNYIQGGYDAVVTMARAIVAHADADKADGLRRVVAIAAHRLDGVSFLYALADDGSLWYKPGNEEWRLEEMLPQGALPV